jgi:hypothetical protein
MAAPSAVQFYANNLDVLRLADLTGATLRLALIGSSYTPSTGQTGHTAWADVSAHEIAAAGGYSAGGLALASPTVTAITGGFRFSTADASVTASGANVGAWRYGVIYVLGSLFGITNPLLGIFTGDSAPADIPATPSGNTLTITCPATGWFTVTRT